MKCAGFLCQVQENPLLMNSWCHTHLWSLLNQRERARDGKWEVWVIHKASSIPPVQTAILISLSLSLSSQRSAAAGDGPHSGKSEQHLHQHLLGPASCRSPERHHPGVQGRRRTPLPRLYRLFTGGWKLFQILFHQLGAYRAI